jgi:hypothetical protein
MSTDSVPDGLFGVPARTRREFLTQTAGWAAGATLLSELGRSTASPAQATEPLLPTIKLGSHDVTRLIIGGNPIYGYSHFNRLLSQHQQAWHTPERVVELLNQCQAKGLNTWQNSYAERTLSDLDRYRAAGGTMHWLCLGKPDWDQNPHFIDDAAKRKPIGIAPHGSLADRLHRQKDLGTLTDLLKRIRDQGVLVGLSAHNPLLIELAEEKGWDIDYYMCCLYNRTRPRNELIQLLGNDVPLGEVYLPSDPPRMFKAIQATRKPCLTYKVLAAGRTVETAQEVYRAFQTAFDRIKPGDAVIVGMYQQFSDQVGENARIVRELCARA